MRTTIVRKEKAGWVYETINISKKGKTGGMQMLVEGFEEAAANKDKFALNIVWLKILAEDGSIQSIEGDQLAIINSFYRSQIYSQEIEKYAVSDQIYEKSGAVAVPAGTFSGTTAIKTETKSMLGSTKYGIFMHPDVPINGMVQAKDEKGNVLLELLDYGTNGKPTIQ